MPVTIEPTIRAVLLERLMARIETISQANGFATDAGQNIYEGVLPALTKADPTIALSILVGDDEPEEWKGEHVRLTLPVEVAVTIRADLADGWTDHIEPALGDLKRAVELADRTLEGVCNGKMSRGATRTLPREAGSEMVGASITWRFPYLEMWGQP